MIIFDHPVFVEINPDQLREKQMTQKEDRNQLEVVFYIPNLIDYQIRRFPKLGQNRGGE